MGNPKVTPELIKSLEGATEQQLREMEAPWPETIDELNDYVQALTTMDHDYGSCVYAMSLSATAAFNYVAHAQGCTGFQASFAGGDIIRRVRSIDGPFSIIDYSWLLYPQHCDKFHHTLTRRTWAWAQEEAKKKLDGIDEFKPHPDVKAHWEKIVAGEIPFGLELEPEAQNESSP